MPRLTSLAGAGASSATGSSSTQAGTGAIDQLFEEAALAADVYPTRVRTSACAAAAANGRERPVTMRVSAGRPGRGRKAGAAGREEVREEAVGTRHTRGELAEERVARVDEGALPLPQDEEPAGERLLARVVALEDRRVAR